MQQQKVAVGVTSAAGYSGSVAAVITALVALAWPSMPHDETVLLAGSVFAAGSFLVTQVGRYWQAVRQQSYVKGAEPVRRLQGEPLDPSLEVPAGSVPVA